MTARSTARLPFAILALAALACAGTRLPDGEDAALYRLKCGGCHRLYSPTELNPASWEEILDRMRIRAHLTDEETETVRRYVKAHLPQPGR